METELTALLAAAATVIVGLMGFVTVLIRRNNKNHNPGVMWEKLWNEHETLEQEIKETRKAVREGFETLGTKLDNNRQEIVGAINNLKR